MDDKTKVVISYFKKSWIETEDRFDSFIENGSDRLIPIREFLKTQKSKGQNAYFRLGTSMDRLIFSRSVQNGLRQDQKYVIIEAYDNHKYWVRLNDGLKTYREYTLNNLYDIKLLKLLNTLKNTLVD